MSESCERRFAPSTTKGCSGCDCSSKSATAVTEALSEAVGDTAALVSLSSTSILRLYGHVAYLST